MQFAKLIKHLRTKKKLEKKDRIIGLFFVWYYKNLTLNGGFDKIKNREKFMRGWKKFLLIFAIVLVFASVPVLFIILNVNGKVYTREQAYALTNKVCVDLGYGSDESHSSSVTDYNENEMSSEFMDNIRGSKMMVIAMRKILKMTDYSEDTYFKMVGERNWGDEDELIEVDFYLFKYKLIEGGVAFDFVTIPRSEADDHYKIVVTLTEKENGWDFDYILTNYIPKEYKVRDRRAKDVFHIWCCCKNEKVYLAGKSNFSLSSKDLYKDQNVNIDDCGSFSYEEINIKTNKHETISASEKGDANNKIKGLIKLANDCYSASFDGVNNPVIVYESELM